MAKNFIQPGHVLTIFAPAAVLAGQVVIAGGIIGIASADAASGAQVDVETVGVWRLPKVGVNDFTIGAVVYWDAATKLATTTSSGNTAIGHAVASAASGTAHVAVKIG